MLHLSSNQRNAIKMRNISHTWEGQKLESQKYQVLRRYEEAEISNIIAVSIKLYSHPGK